MKYTVFPKKRDDIYMGYLLTNQSTPFAALSSVAIAAPSWIIPVLPDFMHVILTVLLFKTPMINTAYTI